MSQSAHAPTRPQRFRSRRVDAALELSFGAARVALIYLGLGLVWIFFSDLALAAMIDNTATLSAIQSIKGFAFVAVTAAVLFLVVRRDTRVLHAAEDELVAASRRQEELADFPRLSPNPILQLDDSAAITYQNAATHDLAEQLGAEGAAGLLPADVAEIVDRARGQQAPVQGVMHDVGQHSIKWEFFPTGNGVYAYGADVTLERAYHSRIAQADKLDTIGRLAAGLAHDFRNALTAIKGLVTSVIDDLPDGDPVKRDLCDVDMATDRAATMLRRLFAIGNESGEREIVEINEEVHGLVPIVRHLLPYDAELEFVRGEPVRASIDPSGLGRVLANLLVNAGDALRDAESGKVTVEVGQQNDNGHATIVVSDNGPGMERDVLSHVFDPFFTTKGPGKGTGLGLSTVRDIIEEAGGTITVESQRGVGTTFRIELPTAA